MAEHQTAPRTSPWPGLILETGICGQDRLICIARPAGSTCRLPDAEALDGLRIRLRVGLKNGRTSQIPYVQVRRREVPSQHRNLPPAKLIALRPHGELAAHLDRRLRADLNRGGWIMAILLTWPGDIQETFVPDVGGGPGFVRE